MDDLVAIVRLDFDPILHMRGPVNLDVAYATLAVAGAIFLAILVAARFADRSGRRTGLPGLRLDDLLFIVLGIIPGAVVGGRLMYALDYLPYYQAHPLALVDPAQGGLSLLGAVIGGAVTGAYIAGLLDSASRWLDVAGTSMLLVIGLGKFAMLLDGAGQGQFWTGAWAVAFVGGGPWLSPSAQIPAQPAQVYEGLWALLGILVVLAVHAGPVLRHLPERVRQAGTWAANRETLGEPVARGRLRFGYLFLVALVWWLVGRIAIAFVWRDDDVLGPLDVEQVAAIVVLLVILIGVLVASIRQPRPLATEERWRVGHRRWRLRGG
ncbi:MAG TPA: prolipoprotein diacylglyceryl transferase family protein [Candidatus Baltobacteraceae bacterium]|nr:prolipoprotein diacylglyceryl transferase family protein [Candidatus Baltobacteraceae bacterium]